MQHFAFIGMLLMGGAFLLLPIILPLFFYRNLQRRTLYYFVGLACCYLCFKIATFGWGILAAILGPMMASLRHENTKAGIDYSFSLILPGLKQGHPQMWLGLAPVVILGTFLSIVALRKIKRSLFKLRDIPGDVSALPVGA
jgi:hypothetical protein